MNCEQFEEQPLNLVHNDTLIIEKIVAESATPIKCISKKHLYSALKKLKKNKAADIMNLTREHFKLGRGVIDGYLLGLLNYIVKKRNISSVLKEGLLIPIYKKGDKSDPSIYRGITVTPVILKFWNINTTTFS